ncbi:glycosyltransferase family 8 protein [Candidatus Pantoea floridensis]|uniref:UDP-glucose:(Glucosyl)LPS alpha-1,3-glucosyltransferase/UDP-D-galactose:(Glucosyl)LPS alpha-1,3-D-galactosyltransferase/UDP-glucose:(Galactosyl)LPS alpha-1,2-glucosyltransferase n=1 Tax=Candidatus Pantoea floridensis TaxID=1938870 RepID=A0A286BSE0_9GAMM|nr:glycosyltransferase [Pantoea floridensis]PIF23606.1 UDP-glucose:(glucosyl)LPS alpha-1,3-glucosyltransferase/UDP-D-galactose:(glucosyl)LPS alpha-1,3-D-galactosyltransferase/UDP-glucose:(galactosyl)LPS alpha-1,2-glucosyltransferase [Enterobacteriaceae bacterium JKS000233]SOD37059.1 UDP-glucose:(glucosyl)LPS alpha-1,3-glucosyltransferase/UDP-D-galactose:(glucosyl)LPSalpha-1,3-D-galactosyltransferase/UDP-glucose:(galactosyl)LPS alpha-1,2-glucosyltransferase [Pantoea floridensis]
MDKDILSTIDSQLLFPVQSDRHIIFGVDGKFIAHSLITIMSIMKHAGSSLYHFHLISSEISPIDVVRLENIFAGSLHGLTLHHIHDELLSAFPTTELFTRATYYRFLAPIILHHAEKLLYLDADIVCLNPIDELWRMNMEPEVIALVVGEIASLQHQLAENVGLHDRRYFNAGVMLIDIKKWNHEQVSQHAFTLLSEKGKYFQYLDQDALNILLEGRVEFIDTRFNTINMLSHDDKGYTQDVAKNTCFLHYAGADKPWQEWNQQQVCHYYRDIYRISPLADLPYERPGKVQHAKRMYKLLFRNHQFAQGIYWRLKYFKMRYF